MKIVLLQKYFKQVPNVKYWDNFIGNGVFNYDYLSSFFNSNNKNLVYLLGLHDNKPVGIFIYEKLKHTNIYKVYLIAKKQNTECKGVGKAFFSYFELFIKKGTIVLIDDSDIPDYYNKLGFKISNGFVNCLFYKFNKVGYYKKIKQKKYHKNINNAKIYPL